MVPLQAGGVSTDALISLMGKPTTLQAPMWDLFSFIINPAYVKAEVSQIAYLDPQVSRTNG